MRLNGLRVLVTRPGKAGELLKAKLHQEGADTLLFPTIAFAKPPDIERLANDFQRLSTQDWLIFISPHAVEYFLFYAAQYKISIPSSMRIAAVGRGTAQALAAANIAPVLYPHESFSSEALLALPEFQQVMGKNVAIVRGLGGREFLDSELIQRGAKVLPLILYQRVVPNVDVTQLAVALNQKQIHVILCSSFDTVSHLCQLVGDQCASLNTLPLIVMSGRVKQLAEALGFTRVFIHDVADHDSLVQFLYEKKESFMSDEQQQTTTPPTVYVKKTSGWYALWVMLFLILFGVFGILGFTKWVQLTEQLKELKSSIQHSAKQNDQRLEPLQAKLNQIEAAQTILKTDVQQQSDTLATWKQAASGNIDRWYVAEARYLVKLAQYEANASTDYTLVSGYLEKAQDILQKVTDPKAVEMRAALKQDQEQVQAKTAGFDIGALFQQLVTLDQQIDKLPFPLQTVKAIELPESNIARPLTKAWWDKGLDETWRVLKDVVVVKKTSGDRPPFLLPDDKSLLQANLHLQIQHAMDGLLRHQAKIYIASLQQAIDWVTRYFKADDAVTVAWLKDASQLQQTDLSLLSLDVSHAVPLFDAYL